MQYKKTRSAATVWISRLVSVAVRSAALSERIGSELILVAVGVLFCFSAFAQTPWNPDGTLKISHGGTGQSSTANAFNSLAPSQTGNNGKFMFTNGSVTSWNMINSLQGIAVGSTSPTLNQVLTYNGTAWVPQTPSTGTVTSVNTGSGLSGGPITTTGTISCNTANGSTFGCLTSTDWTTFNNKQPAGSYITSLTGDVTGSGPGAAASTVVRLQNISVASTSPTTNQVLTFNGTAWVPQTPTTGTVTSVATGSGLSGGPITSTGTVSCITSNGSTFGCLTSTDWTTFNNKQPAGSYVTSLTGDVTGSGPGATASTVIRLQGIAVASTSPTLNQVLTYNGTAWIPQNASGGSGITALTGDVSATGPGSVPATVLRLQGISVSSTSPTSNQVLVYNGTAWAPAPGINQNNRVYVEVNGNDTTCVVGNPALPCATIAHAISIITTAGVSNRFDVILGDGTHTEASPVLMKPYVFIAGNGDAFVTRVNLTGGSTCFGLDPTFTNGRSGISNVNLTGTTGFCWDATTVPGNSGFVFEMNDMWINGTINAKAAVAGAANSFIDWTDVQFFGNVTEDGIIANHISSGTQSGATITLASTNGSSTNAFQGTMMTTLTATNGGGHLTQINMFGSQTTSVSLTGSGVTLTTDSNSLPAAIASVTLASGATIVQTNNANWMKYQPATPGNWSVVPSSVGPALDTLAANAITSLTGDVTATGPRAAAASVVKLQGVSVSTTSPTKGQVLDYNGTAWTPSLIGSTPTFAATANAGSGASASIANATDMAGSLTLTTTAVASSAGIVAEVTFASTYAVAPICQLTAVNANGALDAVIQGVFITSTLTKLQINFANADAVGRTYSWNYFCVETH